jgi:hypothetical protein
MKGTVKISIKVRYLSIRDPLALSGRCLSAVSELFQSIVSRALIVFEKLFEVNHAYTLSLMLSEMGNKIYRTAESAVIGWIISLTSQPNQCSSSSCREQYSLS